MGAFIKGFTPKLYDFLGHNLQRDRLALQRRNARRAERRSKQKEVQMIDSGVQIAEFENEPADKFKDGFEKVTAEIHAYAKMWANELNKNNTATDNINGEFNPEKWNIYQNMIRNAKKFVEHSTNYVEQYETFNSEHMEMDESGVGRKMNDEDVQRVDVFVNREMMDSKLAEGKTYADLTPEERKKLSQNWYGHDKGNEDYYQDVKANDDGEYNYDEQGFLLDTEGNRVRAFNRVGAKGRSPGKLVPMEAKDENGNTRYQYQELFNRPFDDDQLSFTANGDLTYGGTNYYKHWNLDMMKTGLLKDQRVGKDAVSELADELDFDVQRDLKDPSQTTEFFTDEAIDGLRRQARRFTTFRGGNFTRGQQGHAAAHDAAYEILRLQGNSNPSEEEIKRVKGMIMSGISDNGKIEDEFSDVFQYKYGKQKGQKIEHYSDFMSEYILDNYMSSHAMKDMHSEAYLQGGNVLKTPPVLSDDNRIEQISTFGDQYSYLSNNVPLTKKDANQYTNLPRSFSVSRFNKVGDEDLITDLRDVGMITRTPFMNKALGGVSGKTTLSSVGIAYIDRRTGDLITFDNQEDVDHNSAVFRNQEQAKYAYAVPVIQGVWKPTEAGSIESNISVKIQEGGLVKSDGSRINPDDIENALNQDKSVDIYMPLNSLITTQSPGVVNEYQDFIKRANDINEKGIFYRQDGNKIKYEQEENPGSADASGESFDFRFGGEFSSEINV
jgi:hypothetical protein